MGKFGRTVVEGQEIGGSRSRLGIDLLVSNHSLGLSSIHPIHSVQPKPSNMVPIYSSYKSPTRNTPAVISYEEKLKNLRLMVP